MFLLCFSSGPTERIEAWRAFLPSLLVGVLCGVILGGILAIGTRPAVYTGVGATVGLLGGTLIAAFAAQPDPFSDYMFGLARGAVIGAVLLGGAGVVLGVQNPGRANRTSVRYWLNLLFWATTVRVTILSF
jgi:hypothetical protein